MTHAPDDARFTGNAELQALHREIQEPIDEEPQPGTEEEMRLASALEINMFSTMTRAYVDRLLSHGENPSPDLRQQLTRAAARGVEYRRKQQGPLPILLAARREALKIDAGELATDLGLTEVEVYEFEIGKRNVRDVQPETLVAWARAVKTPIAHVVPSLRRALELTRATAGQVAAGRREVPTLSDNDIKLIDRVAELLQEH
jgi:transcriptional regulator with XRE-family HTH domain